ncbi:unnamed protein product [Rotaria sordida]|nr:unnamed protein product [Rotaria sordida]
MDESFLMLARNEVLYQMKRLQSHPSLVMISANNEIEVALAQNWFKIPADRMDKAKHDYRKLYLDVIMKAIQEVDKGNNRLFVVSSPSNGLESVNENYTARNPQDPLYGDVHFYEYTNDTWDPNTYPIPRFMSETGLQSLPSLDSWYQVTHNISDLQYGSAFYQHREHSPNKINDLLNQIKSNLPLPVTSNPLQEFVHMIYLSQINQAMTLKSINDVCRIHSSIDMIDPKTSEGHTMGFMYWQINDIWQAPTWATIEYGLKWKMGHYYVQHLLAASVVLLILICFGSAANLYALDHPDPMTTIHAFCKSRPYIVQSTVMMGRWLVAIACIDRYALTSRSSRIRKFAQVHIARYTIAYTIVVWLILPIHMIIYYEINSVANICTLSYSGSIAFYHSIYTITMGGILPATIMITTAILIRYNLAMKRNLCGKQTNPNNATARSNTNSSAQRIRDQQALIMLFVQVTFYCIVQIPQFVRTMYGAIANNVSNKSADRLAIEKFAFTATEMCAYLFPVSSFYLYVLVSRAFRHELYAIVSTLINKCFDRRNIRIRPITIMQNATRERKDKHMAS